MTDKDIREVAREIDSWILNSSNSPTWRFAKDLHEEVPIWQQETISRVLLFAGESPVSYATSEWTDNGYRLIVLTNGLAVELIAEKVGGNYSVASCRALPLAEISAITLESIDLFPFEAAKWPTRIAVQVTIGNWQARLPLAGTTPYSERALVACFPDLVRSLSDRGRSV